MKIKIYSILFLCILTGYLYAAPGVQSESSLFSEITAAYQSKFYPGAVEHSSMFVKSYPLSPLLSQVLEIEGESLYRLGRLSEAESILQKSCEKSGKDEKLFALSSYWLGRVLFDLQNYTDSCAAFYDASAVSKNVDSIKDIYASSIFYSGKSFCALKNYKDASPLLEYVVSNGSQYAVADYNEALLLLFESYEKTGEYQKTVNVYSQLNGLDQSVSDKLSLYAGEALEGLKNYREAYNLYENVLLNGTQFYAVRALQKAYAVSSEHKKEVQKEPGDVLAVVQEKLSGQPDLLAEFWLRLGIDSFNAGNYSKAASYFAEIPENAVIRIQLVKALYDAEIVVRSLSVDSKSNAAKAQELAESALKKDASLKETDLELYNSYQKNLMKYAALQQNWNDAVLFSKEITTFDAESLYWKSFAEYELSYYKDALVSLENNVDGRPAWNLNLKSRFMYALVLAKNGRTQDSLSVFNVLDTDMASSENIDADFAERVHINYANVLISAGKNEEALEQTKRCSSSRALYLGALADFNLALWNSSCQKFEKFLRSADSDIDSKQRSFAQFYCGYAYYRSNDFDAAYKTLNSFAQQNPSSSLAWDAYMTSASAAISLKKLPLAQEAAEKASKIAVSEERQQKSVLLCAGIYSDSMQYQKALAVLQPYTTKKNDFALQCRFESAQILERNNEIEKADSMYASIPSISSYSPLSEESEYRRGELYYSAKDYNTAVSRFDSYIKKYPNGRFYDAAMYYGAESLVSSGFEDRAVLQYELLLSVRPDSPYRYASLKNLCNLYQQKGAYRDALSNAKIMLSEYGSQAREDKIDKKITELEQLASGVDSRVVQKKSEYENAGGISTASGRKAGTELAELYSKAPDTMKDAASLAEDILAVQKKNIDSESLYAAKNAALLASFYRSQNRNAESAKMYLSAAEYWRMNASSDEAASALYGAVEAFDASASYGDAKEAAATLNKLYPESRQNKAAVQIINRN